MCLVFVVVFIYFDALYSAVMMLIDLFDSAGSDIWGILFYNLPDLSVLLVQIVIDFFLLSFEQLLYFGDVLLEHLFELIAELLFVFDNVIFHVFVAFHQLCGVNGTTNQFYMVQKS
jgi:hypothetical protein